MELQHRIKQFKNKIEIISYNKYKGFTKVKIMQSITREGLPTDISPKDLDKYLRHANQIFTACSNKNTPREIDDALTSSKDQDLMFGSMLYAIYQLNQIQTKEENQTFQTLIEMLKNNYNDPTSFDIKELQSQINTLNNPKALTAIYTMLRCFENSIPHLSWIIQRGINSNLKPEQRKIIISTIEDKYNASTRPPSPSPEAPPPNNDDVPNPNQLNAIFLTILNSGYSEDQQLDQLQQRVNEMQDYIKFPKIEKETLTSNIDKLENFLLACKENNTKKMGRLYFKDLIEQHKEEYSLVIKSLTDEQKEELTNLASNIDSKITTPLLKTASTLAAPITMLVRFTGIDTAINKVLPETNDSLAKKLLEQGINTAKKKFEIELESLNQTISSHDTIEHFIIDTNSLISNYKQIKKDCMGVKRILQESSEDVTVFIEKHDNFIDKVKDWFSRFGKWFSTQSLGEQIKEAKDMKKELDNLKTQHQELVTRKCDSLGSESPLKDKLISFLSPQSEHKRENSSSVMAFKELKKKFQSDISTVKESINPNNNQTRSEDTNNTPSP